MKQPRISLSLAIESLDKGSLLKALSQALSMVISTPPERVEQAGEEKHAWSHYDEDKNWEATTTMTIEYTATQDRDKQHGDSHTNAQA